MNIAATVNSTQDATTTTATKRGMSQMNSDDFLKVLITQLQYQDPFKPMDNEQMLAQMAQIRNMEMSTTLTDSLRTLTEQQRLGSAATLIGQYVTGTVTAADDTQTSISGRVRGIRFETDGQPVLELDSGKSLPLKSIENVTDPSRFVGKYVVGTTTDSTGASVDVQGVVASVKFTADGEAYLQLTSGDALPVAGVTKVSDPPTGTAASSQVASKDGNLSAKIVLGQ